MNITPEQFLAKLAASPADARAFDACSPPGMSRREHVELTLAQVKNSCANVAESKRLADQRKINAALKSDLAKAKNRIAIAQAAIAAKAIAAASAKPQRELTGHARAAAAFAGTANRSAIISTPNLTGHARVSAFFAAQARK